jgi:hypothetical protein
MNVVGRSFGSDTVGMLNEAGDWEVTVRMVEKRMIEGMDWEEKILSVKCTDAEFDKAYTVAMSSTLDQFNDLLIENGNSSMFAPETSEVAEVAEEA